MRNFVMFLCLSAFTIMGSGCSKDDDSSVNPLPVEKKEIVLNASNTSIHVGDVVDFVAKVEGKVLEGVKFYISDREIGNPYVFNEAGTFTVIAKKEGYKNSLGLSIVVEANQEKAVVIRLLTPEDQLFVGEAIEIKVFDENNNPIDGAELLANGEPTEIMSNNGFFRFNIKAAGTYKVHVRYDEIDSNSIDLKVIDRNAAVGQGEFLFKGEKFKCIKAITTYEGIYNVEKDVLSGWSEMLFAEDGTVAFFAYFTPTVDLGGGQYEAVFPTESNIIRVMAGVMSSTQDLLGQTKEPDSLTLSYKVSKIENDKITGDLSSIDGFINELPFKVNYSGEHYLITKGKLPEIKQASSFEDIWKNKLFSMTNKSLFEEIAN